MLDKPVINLDFDPPGSNLPWCLGYERHIRFDHYRPVAESGAVMVARSPDEMRSMIHSCFVDPNELAKRRRGFISTFFSAALDGTAGINVAKTLTTIAKAVS